MKWRPSKTARREFASRMEDPAEKAAYEQRKADKAAKRRAGSRYDYDTAGGNYVPTRIQYDYAMNRPGGLTPEQIDACNMVIFGYNSAQSIHHDHIHIVNELIRTAQ